MKTRLNLRQLGDHDALNRSLPRRGIGWMNKENISSLGGV